MSSDSEVEQATSKNSKKRAIEDIYQKKTPLEHILLRPDTYVGSIEKHKEEQWIYDNESNCMIKKQIEYVPGLYKIFDEILVNAADNKQRDKKMSAIKIQINKDDGMISIWNNGKGIPVVHHKEEKMYVPSLIFGHLLTSSNYDDDEKKVTGGRNGYGAKLTNIFSKQFIVETSCKESKASFKQVWKDNMTKTTEPSIRANKSEDFTQVTFYPDLSKFKMKELEDDTVQLFTRRAYDLAAATSGVTVYLNDQKLPIKGFKDYVELFCKHSQEEDEEPPKIAYQRVNDRWEVALTISPTGFQHVSFVNSIATTKGGRHVDFVADKVVSQLIEKVKKKSNSKESMDAKPFQVKNHMWLFVNCLIENPSFDSQTKETMTLQAKNFGSTCDLNKKFFDEVYNTGIVERVLNWLQFKAQIKLDQNCKKTKQSNVKVNKLSDANKAGTKDSRKCTLILTEGDSAKTLAMAGLGVVGRDHYGVFPLKGKLLNVRDASYNQVLNNEEIKNIIKALGLQYSLKYDDPSQLEKLRYGKVMIMADQDQDGSHIKGLIINFIHNKWPHLLRHNFVEQFITPIVKVFKGQDREISFFSIPEFEEWQNNTRDWHTWRVKYYKGLGTSTGKEAKEYFYNMERHRIRFKHSGPEDDDRILLAFSKSKINERKEWLTSWMDERRRRSEMGLPETYLYGKDTKVVTYNDFVNKELVLFSNMDNERSIPAMMDGLKPGQRKVLFTCFKRNLVREIKVAQLAGSVAEMSAYHHGEASLMSTIVGLAQNFVGSNNINILYPSGQFGSRASGGKDSASPRYIFTRLMKITRTIFHPDDDAILNYLRDDNLKVEPEWYAPIIPMVLVNGSEGIGTGWSTKVLNFCPREIVANLKRLLEGEEPLPMLPKFRQFRGVIKELDANRYVFFGEVAVLNDNQIEITELPVRTWTNPYKEVLDFFETGLDPKDSKDSKGGKDAKGAKGAKKPKGRQNAADAKDGNDDQKNVKKVHTKILNYSDYCTDDRVRFVVNMKPEQFREAENKGLHNYFKLVSTQTCNSLVLFDQDGVLKRFDSPLQILKDFFNVRLHWYDKRKTYMVGLLSAEALKLENQARFILEKIDFKIKIEGIPKKQLIKMLVDAKYDSDPVKAFRISVDKMSLVDEQEGSAEVKEPEEEGPDFNYILNMPLWNLTKEKCDNILKNKESKQLELKTLRKKPIKEIWLDDLDAFLKALGEMEQEEVDEKKILAKKAIEKDKKSGKKSKMDVEPSIYGQRIEPEVGSEMLQKASKEKLKKLKTEVAAGKKREDGVQEDSDDDDDLPKPLSERLSTGGASDKAKSKTAKVASKKAPAPKQSKKVSEPKAARGKKGSPTKSKKKLFDSDDENSISGIDSDFDDSYVAPVRERVPRRGAAAKVTKYNLDDDEEEEEEFSDKEFQEVDHGQGDRPIKVENGASDNDEDNDDEYSIADSEEESDHEDSPVKKKKSSPVKKAPAAKKAPVRKSKTDDDDDSPVKKRVQKQAKLESDSDDDFDKSSPVKKAPAAKKAPVKKSKTDDDDDSPVKKRTQKKPKLESDSDDFNLSDNEASPKKKSVAAKKAPAKKTTKNDSPVKKQVKKRKSNYSESDLSDDDYTSKEPLAKRARAAVERPKYVFDDMTDSD